MGHLCRVCVSPHRNAIDDSLEKGELQYIVAQRYGMSPASVSRHLSLKHPRAVPLSEIGDEPVLPSYEWIKQQANARALRTDELLVLSPTKDPFYCGSPTNLSQAQWFKDLWERFGYGDDEDRKHLRRLHYRCVVSEPPPRWPDRSEYRNTERDFGHLCNYSRHARWLEYVDAEFFEDKRAEPPIFNAPEKSPDLLLTPWVSGRTLEEWDMPEIESDVFVPDWELPEAWLHGYEADRYADQPSMVCVWIEKSTMNSWLVPLCQELGVDLFVGTGYFSITSAVTFVKRAVELAKPAHLLVISDCDPQGTHMPLSAARHIEYRIRQDNKGCEVTVDALAVTPEQVKRYKLPRVPIQDSNLMRTRFEMLYGEGAVELDALEALRPRNWST